MVVDICGRGLDDVDINLELGKGAIFVKFPEGKMKIICGIGHKHIKGTCLFWVQATKMAAVLSE